MKPTNKHEEEIAQKVDQKARAIGEGVGAWDDRIISEMHVAVGFEMNVAEQQFLENYVAWRRQNPIREE
jgi:hypothetical protein